MQRQNIIYSLVLGCLCVALMIVGILLLRRRSPPTATILPVVSGKAKDLPPVSRPLESYTPEPPFQPGSPAVPQNQELIGE